MNLKIQLLCFVMCCVFFKAHSQTLSNKVVATSGSYSTASWGSLSATVGEAAIITLTSANVTLLQGFQQPTSGLSGIIANKSPVPINAVYPNPASSQLFLEVTLPSTSTVTYKMFDMNGKEITTGNFTVEAMQTSVQKMDVAELSSGMYLITLYADAYNIQNFKILINH